MTTTFKPGERVLIRDLRDGTVIMKGHVVDVRDSTIPTFESGEWKTKPYRVVEVFGRCELKAFGGEGQGEEETLVVGERCVEHWVGS